MTEDEKIVRETWGTRDNGKPYLDVFFNCFWNVWVNGDMFVFPQFATEPEAWSAAAQFTRERIEQVRQIDEEIELLHVMSVTKHARAIEIMKRTLSRLQAIRGELTKGMKEICK